MFFRAVALAGGLAGAVGLSQFPEFSQQYLQRLAGAVDEMRLVVSGFDLTARAAGMTREEALAQMDEAGFEAGLRDRIAESIRRYDKLNADYQSLREATPLGRLAQPWNLADPELARNTWQDFRPAVPATLDGVASAGIGYALGWGLVAALLSLLARPFRRRRA